MNYRRKENWIISVIVILFLGIVIKFVVHAVTGWSCYPVSNFDVSYTSTVYIEGSFSESSLDPIEMTWDTDYWKDPISEEVVVMVVNGKIIEGNPARSIGVFIIGPVSEVSTGADLRYLDSQEEVYRVQCEVYTDVGTFIIPRDKYASFLEIRGDGVIYITTHHREPTGVTLEDTY